jgi:mRNA-degrading endonuclease RelE of RelBE toxin-antitoxin system
MAFQINTPIGTNEGIITGAYVRIGGYDVNKNGNIVFIIDVFRDKDATEYDTAYIPVIHPNKLQSKEIGISLDLKMTNKIEYTKTITKQVDGVDTEMEETFTKKVSDLSVFENKTIFEVGYEKLGEKLASLYGAENIETV